MAIGIGQNYDTSQESMHAIGIDEAGQPGASTNTGDGGPRPGRSHEAPPGPSAPTNCPIPPAGFVTHSGHVSKPPGRLDL